MATSNGRISRLRDAHSAKAPTVILSNPTTRGIPHIAITQELAPREPRIPSQAARQRGHLGIRISAMAESNGRCLLASNLGRADEAQPHAHSPAASVDLDALSSMKFQLGFGLGVRGFKDGQHGISNGASQSGTRVPAWSRVVAEVLASTCATVDLGVCVRESLVPGSLADERRARRIESGCAAREHQRTGRGKIDMRRPIPRARGRICRYFIVNERCRSVNNRSGVNLVSIWLRRMKANGG